MTGYGAYDKNIKTTESPHETDAAVLEHAAQVLIAAQTLMAAKEMDNDDDFFMALNYNQRIWTVLQAFALEETLPDQIKANLLSFRIFVDKETYKGVSLNEMLHRMDDAGIEKAFLVAPKIGREGLAGSYSIPYQLIVEALKEFPDRFYGLAGIDPYTGMNGVKEFEDAITEMGFIGAHVYPHWFELAPDHAKYYPFYAKCVELGVPIQMQVGQSLIYSPNNPMRSVGRPITIDTVACDFPELKIIGIHIGIPVSYTHLTLPTNREV